MYNTAATPSSLPVDGLPFCRPTSLPLSSPMHTSISIQMSATSTASKHFTITDKSSFSGSIESLLMSISSTIMTNSKDLAANGNVVTVTKTIYTTISRPDDRYDRISATTDSVLSPTNINAESVEANICDSEDEEGEEYDAYTNPSWASIGCSYASKLGLQKTATWSSSPTIGYSMIVEGTSVARKTGEIDVDIITASTVVPTASSVALSPNKLATKDSSTTAPRYYLSVSPEVMSQKIKEGVIPSPKLPLTTSTASMQTIANPAENPHSPFDMKSSSTAASRAVSSAVLKDVES